DRRSETRSVGARERSWENTLAAAHDGSDRRAAHALMFCRAGLAGRGTALALCLQRHTPGLRISPRDEVSGRRYRFRPFVFAARGFAGRVLSLGRALARGGGMRIASGCGVSSDGVTPFQST